MCGQGQGAVFAEAAVVQQVGKVFSGAALAGLAPLGHGLGAAGIGEQGVTLQHLGEVGANMRQVQALLIMLGAAVDFGGLDKQQGLAFREGVARLRRQGADDAAVAGLDHELHLHRFQHGDALASGHGIALGHLQAHQHAGIGSGQRHTAGRGVDAVQGGGHAGTADGEIAMGVGLWLGCEQLA